MAQELVDGVLAEDDRGRLERIDGITYVFATCVGCGGPIERECPKSLFLKQKRFYCSTDCLNESQRTGVAKQVKEVTFTERYGVTNPGAIPAVKEQKKLTIMARYGVENASQIPEVSAKKSVAMKRICEETDFLARGMATQVERFGSHYFATSKARGELKQYALETYGVDHHMKSEEHREERRLAFQVRHGVDNPMQLEDVKQKSRETCLERYGVDNVFKRPDVVQKRIKKMVENAQRQSSDGEHTVYEVLCGAFDVKQHLVIFYRERSFWVVDFLLTKHDVYVQYDGIYWHGLGKDVEELKRLSKMGDKSAKMQVAAINRDRYQNRWFAKNGMKLFRIVEGTATDVWAADLQAYLDRAAL
jgi:hypothetical protein